MKKPTKRAASTTEANSIASWYDAPEYYDIAFQGDTKQEADFLLAVCKKYGKVEPERLLEPGCGSGRLVRELTARGYFVEGFDRSAAGLTYARKSLGKFESRAHLFEADLGDFRVEKPVQAAYCFCNTFRHLLTEAEAKRHLELVAGALVTGGIYCLGLHLLPDDADLSCREIWSEQRRKTRVNVTLDVTESSRETRLETIRTNMKITVGTKITRIRSFDTLRLYNHRQLKSLLRKVHSFELCDVFDFWLDETDPLALNDEISDTVLILRKR